MFNLPKLCVIAAIRGLRAWWPQQGQSVPSIASFSFMSSYILWIHIYHHWFHRSEPWNREMSHRPGVSWDGLKLVRRLRQEFSKLKVGGALSQHWITIEARVISWRWSSILNLRSSSCNFLWWNFSRVVAMVSSTFMGFAPLLKSKSFCEYYGMWRSHRRGSIKICLL